MTKFYKTLKDYNPSLTSESSIAEGGREAMRRAFIQLLAHEAGGDKGNDIEDIHQMRVATRRIRTLFDLLSAYYKRSVVADYEKYLKKLADRLGNVRDLDVQIRDLQNYLDEQKIDNSESKRILQALGERRRKTHRKLTKFLRDKNYKKFRRTFSQFLQSQGKGEKSLDPMQAYQIRHVLPVIIQQHLAAVRAFDALINQDNPPFHELRIECKQLRYVLEAFEDMLGSTAGGFLDELKQMQDQLGAMQDVDVATALFDDVFDLAKSDKLGNETLQDYLAYRAKGQQQLEAEFDDLWKEFTSRKVQQRLAEALLVLR